MRATLNVDIAKITIDNDSGVPLWLQLRNRLIYLIDTGSFGVGDKLPTMRELAVNLGVNYNTISKVYRDIERDGYITSVRGKGTFVAQAAPCTNGGSEAGVALARDFVRQCREIGIPESDMMDLLKKALGEQK